ncbi:MAG: lysyl oxidase family protein [Saprospiraceae bacterium]
MQKLLFLLLLMTAFGKLMPCIAQTTCGTNERLITITILTDRFGYETSWELSTIEGVLIMKSNRGAYTNNRLYTHNICVPAETCLTFTIKDSYGDGILSPGYFQITTTGNTLLSNQAFSREAQFKLFCETGEACSNPKAIQVNQSYVAAYDDSWYQFSPDSIGLYQINTCGMNSCDTKIWVYDTCEGNGDRDDNAGTIFFNDDSENCGLQANVQAFLQPGKAYLIRIGDKENDCTDLIHWEIQYLGQVVGCTDPNSCNYNPLATIDDGSCIPRYDPACPQGPDLAINETSLINSLKLDTINVSDQCLIQEQCVNGYGRRDIIRFDTEIHNIGEKAYFLGIPSTTNNQFTWNNCHNHLHYEGYAEYLVFDALGNKIPGGFKNGFCVMDSSCPEGEQQFSCDLMGISPGCLDRYWAELQCQWVDVTDIPDGMYTLVTRVNWNNAPDYLGQYEENIDNNWAQVCIYLDRSSGTLQMTVDPDCQPVTDCTGQPYGAAKVDCEGVCNGSAVRGDMDGNGVLNQQDLALYIDGIMSESLGSSPCLDLSGDGQVTIYDAALLQSCLRYGTSHIHSGQGTHDHCEFPAGLQNFRDSAQLSILNLNYEAGYVDLAIRNPTSNIMAYQLKMDGFSIIRAESLVDPIEYPVALRNNINKALVAGLSFEQATIRKSDVFQPLCRIYFFDNQSSNICLEEVIELVNEYGEQVIPIIDNGCIEQAITSTSSTAISSMGVDLQPNPAKHQTTLLFSNPHLEAFRLDVFNSNGQKVFTTNDIRTEQYTLLVDDLPTGHYFFRLSSPRQQGTGKFMVF